MSRDYRPRWDESRRGARTFDEPPDYDPPDKVAPEPPSEARSTPAAPTPLKPLTTPSGLALTSHHPSLRDAILAIEAEARSAEAHEGGPLCIDCDKPFQHARSTPAEALDVDDGRISRGGWHYPSCWELWVGAWYRDEFECICARLRSPESD
jgi:hypothetical protein